jgi:hypothetical protein
MHVEGREDNCVELYGMAIATVTDNLQVSQCAGLSRVNLQDQERTIVGVELCCMAGATVTRRESAGELNVCQKWADAIRPTWIGLCVKVHRMAGAAATDGLQLTDRDVLLALSWWCVFNGRLDRYQAFFSCVCEDAHHWLSSDLFVVLLC